MALVLADRVQEYSTTTGTGTLTLSGAYAGFQTFASGIGNGNTCYYTIISDTNQWEVGIGTVGVGTLARTTLISSSTGSLVSFVGTLTVFVTYPAEKAVYSDSTTIVAPTGALLPITSGGTGASTAAAARTALGLGTIATQNANSVAVTGGAISGTSITVTDNVFTLQDNLDPTKQAQFQVSAVPTATTATYNLPYGTITPVQLPALNVPLTFTSNQTFSATSNSFGTSTATGTTSLAVGATLSGSVKNLNIGTGGLSGSTTAITVGSANGSTTTMLGSTVIGGAAGSQSLQVNNVASAVNYAQIVGAVSGSSPTISAQGTDTNIALYHQAKGSGNQFFASNGGVQFGVGSTLNPVNYPYFYGSLSGNGVVMTAAGSDANISYSQSTKGTGNYNFYTASFAANQVIISHTASAVNYLNLTGAATGNAPTISAQGSDTNINLTLTPKGTGVTRFTSPILMQRSYGTGSLIGLGGGTAYSVGTTAAGIDNDTVIDATKTSSYSGFATFPSTAAAAFTIFSLNHYIAQFFQLGAGSAITNQFGFVAHSSLSNATNNYGFYGNIAAATGRFNFYANGTAANVFVGQTSLGGTVGAEALRAVNTASAVNYVQALGAVTTGAPELSAQGSDTNINLKLTPKGTGVLQFGTHTATVLTPTGFITITDAGGTSRRLLVG